MESWVPYFVAIVALATVVQTIMMVAIFVSVSKLGRSLEQTATELRSRVAPILGRVQMILDDAHPQITSVMSDAAQITQLARSQVQNADRVIGDAFERLRLQLAHADKLLTNALTAVEDAGATFRRTVFGPVQTAVAVLRGVQTGLEFFRGKRRRPANSNSEVPAETQDEGLFI